jgi:hypothetical protein
MTLALTPYASVQSNLFVRIDIDEYRTSPDGSYSAQVLKFSDLLTPHTIEGESYLGIGKLLSVSSSSSELRISGGEVTLTISGIPNASISEIVNSKIKGSPIRIYRALFNAQTGQFLSITGNPVGRFSGFINNYSLQEEYDEQTRTSSNTIVLTCANKVDVLGNKISGRRTNPQSQKKFYSTDTSMDRVPNLINAYFDFGAPQ